MSATQWYHLRMNKISSLYIIFWRIYVAETMAKFEICENLPLFTFEKRLYLPQRYSDKGLKGTVVNRTLEMELRLGIYSTFQADIIRCKVSLLSITGLYPIN